VPQADQDLRPPGPTIALPGDVAHNATQRT